ncbi:MAG: type II toxin-antitoxin system VapC family toxin [Elusimicrobia bacterium]|nr:type II toxin-antitoxin system VapC family toxin [Elusimicrobiota bacterium]
MRVLLDTHILLWALVEPNKLAQATRVRIEDSESEILFSAASIWEIAIKLSLGRLPAQARPDLIAHAAVESGFVELPVRAEAAAIVAKIPLHHRDPFDRLLVAQAIAEPAVLCTVDKKLSRYSHLVKII